MSDSFVTQFKAAPLWQWVSILAALAGIVTTCPAFASPANGKISYEAARSLYDKLKQPVWDTGLFNKKSFQERTKYMKAGKDLEKQFEVFGVGSQCLGAAIMRNAYIQALHNYANILEGRVQITGWQDFTIPMYNAFTYGEQVAACYEDVEALDKRR
jgi:hypothetical protein